MNDKKQKLNTISIADIALDCGFSIRKEQVSPTEGTDREYEIGNPSTSIIGLSGNLTQFAIKLLDAAEAFNSVDDLKEQLRAMLDNIYIDRRLASNDYQNGHDSCKRLVLQSMNNVARLPLK